MGIDLGVKRDQIPMHQSRVTLFNLNYDIKTWTNWLKDIWKFNFFKNFLKFETRSNFDESYARNCGKGPAEAYLKPSQTSTMELFSENCFPERQNFGTVSTAVQISSIKSKPPSSNSAKEYLVPKSWGSFQQIFRLGPIIIPDCHV